MEEQQVAIVSQVDTLQAITKSEMDIQIATAKHYPRDIARVSENIRALAMFDDETMEACVYKLEREDKGGVKKLIEGPTVRLAEICVSQWGNLRTGRRIISNDGKRITAQGICFDLETNVSATIEMQRKITTSKGFTYSEDMQTLTGNAAASIAFRNAVFTVIPKVVINKVLKEIKEKMLEKAKANPDEKLKAVLDWFHGKGVTDAELCAYLGIKDVNAISAEHIVNLRQVATAIQEGVSTVDDTFRPKVEQTPDEKKEAMRAAKTSVKGKAAPTLL